MVCTCLPVLGGLALLLLVGLVFLFTVLVLHAGGLAQALLAQVLASTPGCFFCEGAVVDSFCDWWMLWCGLVCELICESFWGVICKSSCESF